MFFRKILAKISQKIFQILSLCNISYQLGSYKWIVVYLYEPNWATWRQVAQCCSFIWTTIRHIAPLSTTYRHILKNIILWLIVAKCGSNEWFNYCTKLRHIGHIQPLWAEWCHYAYILYILYYIFYNINSSVWVKTRHNKSILNKIIYGQRSLIHISSETIPTNTDNLYWLFTMFNNTL